MAHVSGRITRAAKAAREKVGSVYSTSAVAALECPRSAWRGLPGRCRWCNSELEGKRTAWCSDVCHQEFELNHIFSEGRQVVLRKARWTCEREGCAVRSDLQVNHIDPVVGQGYHPSCYHHLDNLEALCRPHHQIETNAQRQHRQVHWTEDALDGRITLPDSGLEKKLRQDLIRRMLDRASGHPFLLPGEDFEATGLYHRYRPNTKWPVILADLQANYKRARVWEPKEQAWVSLSYYSKPTVRCQGRTGAGKLCSRFGSLQCWQHGGLAAPATAA